MMANAMKDPLWQAKVSAEVAAHPEYKQLIEDKCTTCHTPLGRTEAHYNGAQNYSLQEAQGDPLARDGVSCTLCHQINDSNLGTPESFSGHYIIQNDRLIYGPYQSPFTAPMQMMVNYTPVFGEQVEQSSLCGTCHTLFTPTIDNDGNIAGEIPEQTPFLEWRNSRYPADDVECQTCHMPATEESIVISNRPPTLAARTPFAKHFFVGANLFMLRMLKAHAAEIGVAATPAQIDSTIARTLGLLQNETATLGLSYDRVTAGTVEIRVSVKNLTGHKFPTAYPSRRAWIHLQLLDGTGAPIFESGSWDPLTGEIDSLGQPYETHHDIISGQGQTQVYQALMQDVDSAVTWTLLRGASYIKDNRMPPEGFTSGGPHYDSTRIVGLAEQDLNFNRISGFEGTGTDTVIYRIDQLNDAQSITAIARLLYQSAAPRFVEDLLAYDTPEVNRFASFYQGADKAPIVIDSARLVILSTDVKGDISRRPFSASLKGAYPNPFNSSTTIQYQLGSAGFVRLTVYDQIGNAIAQLVSEAKPAGDHTVVFDAESFGSGVYYYRLYVGEYTETKKMIHLK
jgi:hypothetical protein